MTTGNNEPAVEVGIARGWNVWQLENGEWAWTGWAGESLGLARSGVEETEAKAQETALRETRRHHR